MITTLRKRHEVNGNLTDYQLLQLSDPTATYGLRRQSNSEIIIAAETNFVRDSLGLYHLVTPDLITGETYEGYIKRQYADETDYDPFTFVALGTTDLALSTVAEADTYFSNKLYTDLWTSASGDEKQQALNSATALINRFCYKGSKTVADQIHEFPRTGIYVNGTMISDSIIPDDILRAQYEFAFAYIKRIDPEREIRNARVTSRGYSSARITYDSSRLPEHLLQGVPSALGWSYLLPYLCRDSSGIIKIHRVD